MSRLESGYSERVGARISPELKQHLQVLVREGIYESEADAVREALWQHVEQREIVPMPEPAPSMPTPPDNGQIEWLLSTLLVMIALVGSRVLNAVSNEKITPAALTDEAIQETIWNRPIIARRIKTARHLAQQVMHDGKG